MALLPALAALAQALLLGLELASSLPELGLEPLLELGVALLPERRLELLPAVAVAEAEALAEEVEAARLAGLASLACLPIEG